MYQNLSEYVYSIVSYLHITKKGFQKSMIELCEPVNVWVFFKKGNITPYVFFWNKRRIAIDKINLMHQSREGDKTLYHFSVSSGGNFYKLGFDSADLKWVIEATEEDGVAIS